MKKDWILYFLVSVLINTSYGQDVFHYSLELNPVSILGLPGLHSYVFAQSNGKWLIIGGRKDGLHPRQPNSSFPSSSNNTDIYVIDVENLQFWTSSINSLAIGLKEQLQATNINFHQDTDTLYIIGGYAYSPTAVDHITFPYLTTVEVSALINAVINGLPIQTYFKQITDPIFAVTGGQLGKIGNTFYLVGGHRFDGRYNPNNNPTFTQTYTNQIQKFTINNSGSQLSFSNYTSITDPVHLRRRDYNLLPQIFPDGKEGFTISSGVFQINADLPYLYPVDITEEGYTPVTSFNQYLSNYHCASANLYDSIANQMHSLFFGGMSQYYYQNEQLIQDDLVPFVKTISRLTRYADGTIKEYQLPIEMPGLKGSSAEFIVNQKIPHFDSEIIKLSEITEDTILIGHILGGIVSPTINPFSLNQTATTSADNSIYSVTMIRGNSSGVQEIDGINPYDFKVYPNPSSERINISYNLKYIVPVEYYITSINGQIIEQGKIKDQKVGFNEKSISIKQEIPPQILNVTLIYAEKFFVTKKLSRL